MPLQAVAGQAALLQALWEFGAAAGWPMVPRAALWAGPAAPPAEEMGLDWEPQSAVGLQAPVSAVL